MKTELNLRKIKTALPILLLMLGLTVNVAIAQESPKAEAEQLYNAIQTNLLTAADIFGVSLQDEIVVGVGATDVIGSAIDSDFQFWDYRDYDQDGKRVGVIDVAGFADDDLPDGQYAVEITADSETATARLIGVDGSEYYPEVVKRDINDWERGSIFGIKKGSSVILYFPPGGGCCIEIWINY